jgi:hypothetical protein
MPYGPHLEPSSEASKEAVKKRKNDAGTRPAGKRANMPIRKTVVSKALAAPKNMGAALLKIASAHTRAAPMTGAPPRAGALPKASAPPKATVTKTAATPAAPKAGVLRVSIGVKRPSSV